MLANRVLEVMAVAGLIVPLAVIIARGMRHGRRREPYLRPLPPEWRPPAPGQDHHH